MLNIPISNWVRRLALVALLPGGASWAADSATPPVDDSARRLTPQQVDVSQVAVPPSALQVGVWTDRPSGLYSPGESVRVRFRLNRAARVTILNVDAQGLTTVLFPNKWETNNQIASAGSFVIPGDAYLQQYKLGVSEPYGANLIKVIATDAQVAPVPYSLGANEAFATASLAGRALADHIRQITQQHQKNLWAMSEYAFGVVPVGSPCLSSPTPGCVQPAPAPMPPLPCAPAPGCAPAPAPQPVPTPVPTPSPAPAFDLGMLTSDFGLDMRASKQQYKVGERLSLTVSAERKCELGIVEFDPAGKAKVLLPNKVDEKTVLQPGRAHFVSGESSAAPLQVTQPGTFTLVAVCAADKGFFESIFGRQAQRAAATAEPTVSVDDLLNGKDKDLVARHATTYVAIQ